MEDFAHAAQIETEVVEGGKLILFAVGLGDVVGQRLCLDAPEASEVEVITQGTSLVVNYGMFLHLAFHHLVVVGVNHDGIRIISHSEESLQRVVSPSNGGVAGTDHHVVGICIFSDAGNGVTAFQSVGNNKRASFRHLMMSGKISTHQEVDMLYSLVLMKHRQGILRIADVFARQEKVYFFSHFLTLFLFISALFGGLNLCFLSLFYLIILKYVAKILIFRQKTLSLQYE